MSKTQTEINGRLTEGRTKNMMEKKTDPYEQVKQRIRDLIYALENGAGLTDEIFTEINKCIADMKTIDQEVFKADVITDDAVKE